MKPPDAPLGPVRRVMAVIGEQIVYALIRIFGRRVEEADMPWLVGPTGRDYIGDRPYEEWAEREGLSLERDATEGGLVDDMTALASPHFDASRVDPMVRDFYEHTGRYRMDVWARTYFPANIALWLLVTTISRKVDQLNFPLRMLDTAKGMESEIVHLRDSAGRLRYAGWYRRLAATGRSVYTGFYMTEEIPEVDGRCIKVVFPMPNGNATVILAPRFNATGAFELVSDGRRFGDVGFYRIQRIDGEHLRVWYIRSLKERFRLYVDEPGSLRCDHTLRFLGLPVLHLHYRIDTKNDPRRRRQAPPSPEDEASG